MLVSETAFETLLRLSGATYAARPIRELMLSAASNKEFGGQENRICEGFARAVLAWLEREAMSGDVAKLLGSMELAGLILAHSTHKRRQLIAGVGFHRLLESAARSAPFWKSASLPAIQKGEGRVCYLTSEILPSGGHTRVIEDYVRLTPDYRHTVIVTDPRGQKQEAYAHALRPGTRCDVHVLEDADRLAKIGTALQILSDIRPNVVFGLGHAFDPIVPIIQELHRAPKRVHVHHSDHCFSFVPVAADFPVAVLFRGAEPALRAAGVRKFAYLPVTCTDPYSEAAPVQPELLPPMRPDVFTTATCGADAKFRERAGAKYTDLLAARFAGRGGRHVHIGPLAQAQQDGIKALAAARGWDFIHVPFVSSLAAALVKLRPDIYIGSYPTGGKRASIEAMAAGCPIAAWQDEGYHSAAEIIYPGHLRWRKPAELKRIVAGFTPAKRDRHARLSRAHFEGHHWERQLRRRLRTLLQDGGSAALVGATTEFLRSTGEQTRRLLSFARRH